MRKKENYVLSFQIFFFFFFFSVQKCDLTETTLLSVQECIVFIFFSLGYSLQMLGMCRWGVVCRKGKIKQQKKNK